MKIDEETSTIIFGIFFVFFGIVGAINLGKLLTRDDEMDMYKKTITNFQELIAKQKDIIDKLYKELNQR